MCAYNQRSVLKPQCVLSFLFLGLDLYFFKVRRAHIQALKPNNFKKKNIYIYLKILRHQLKNENTIFHVYFSRVVLRP